MDERGLTHLFLYFSLQEEGIAIGKYFSLFNNREGGRASST